jgi:hypothetical protein
MWRESPPKTKKDWSLLWRKGCIHGGRWHAGLYVTKRRGCTKHLLLTQPYSCCKVSNSSPVKQAALQQSDYGVLQLLILHYGMVLTKMHTPSTYPKSGILVLWTQNVSKVWLEVRALNIHSVCDELLVPLFPLYMDQSTEMLVLALDTNQLMGTTQQLNQVHQVDL